MSVPAGTGKVNEVTLEFPGPLSMIRLGLLVVTVMQPGSPGPFGHIVAPAVGPTTGVKVMLTGTCRPWPTVALETEITGPDDGTTIEILAEPVSRVPSLSVAATVSVCVPGVKAAVFSAKLYPTSGQPGRPGNAEQTSGRLIP